MSGRPYHLRGLEDLVSMLKAHGDWMPLGNADEGKPVQPGTLEAWTRDAANPVGGYYGLGKGDRGRFANDVCPIAEAVGLVELEHNPKNNRIRAKSVAASDDVTATAWLCSTRERFLRKIS